MEQLLKFIFILILIYYGFVLFMRYAMPWLLNRFIRKQQKRMFGDMPPFGQAQQPKNEPETKEHRTSRNHHDDGDFGEYVDFEEIKD